MASSTHSAKHLSAKSLCFQPKIKIFDERLQAQ